MSGLIDGQRPIAVLKGVNLNATGDNAISIPNGSQYYRVSKVLVTNASANLSGGSLQYGVFTSTGGSGTVVANGVNSATSLTAATKVILPTVAQTDVTNASTIYFRVGTANGSAATADVYVFIDILPAYGVS